MTKTYCASEEAYRRQWKIARCLIQQMEQRPYRQITVSSLCQDVGISRTAFYRHFENKEACLAFILEQMVMDTCIPALSSGSAADLYPDILRCVQSWRRWAGMMQLLAENGLGDLLVRQTCLHLLREENHLLSHPGSNEELLFGLSGFTALLMQWHNEGYSRSDEEMAGILSRITARLFGQNGEKSRGSGK